MISQAQIVDIVADHFKCSTDTIYNGYGARAILMRQVAILFCRNIGCYKNHEIATHFKQDRRMASYSYLIIKEKLKKNEQFGNFKLKAIVKSVYEKILEEMEKDPDVNTAAVKTVKARVAAGDKSEITS